MNILELEKVIIDDNDRIEESIISIKKIIKSYKEFLLEIESNDVIRKLYGYKYVCSNISDEINKNNNQVKDLYEDLSFSKLFIENFKYLNDHVLCANGVDHITYDLYYVTFVYNNKSFHFYANQRFAKIISGVPPKDDFRLDVRIDFDPGYLTPEQALEELPFMSFHLDLLQ